MGQILTHPWYFEHGCLHEENKKKLHFINCTEKLKNIHIYRLSCERNFATTGIINTLWYGTAHTKRIQSYCNITCLIKPIVLLQQNATWRNTAYRLCVCWLFAAVQPLAHSASFLHQWLLNSNKNKEMMCDFSSGQSVINNVSFMSSIIHFQTFTFHLRLYLSSLTQPFSLANYQSINQLFRDVLKTDRHTHAHILYVYATNQQPSYICIHIYSILAVSDSL